MDVYNEMAVASASFATTTALLSLLDASGGSIAQIQFAGDGSGLRLNASTAGGLAHIAINDGLPQQGNIPLIFDA